MNRLLGSIVLPLVACVASFGQQSEQLDKCMDTAMSQLAMNVCASEEARRVDAELAAVYKQLRSELEKYPGGAKKVRALEKAWAAYRDAYIEAMYPAEDKQLEYGSIFPTEVSLLRATMTREQIKAVKELLNDDPAPKP